MDEFSFALKDMQGAKGEKIYYYSLPALEKEGLGNVSRLPFSVKILLESMVRLQSHPAYTAKHVSALGEWLTNNNERVELPYLPSRILLQDFTGVPCVVDLAALRSALQRTGQDPTKIEPMIPVDLVIDHSVQIDKFGTPGALECNLAKEFERNNERYLFLRWGQEAFEKLRILPPGLGICHQINMEYLATCVTTTRDAADRLVAYPDTLVGTDSHTVMINSMGVLGWGVGGIEAEAAMLGEPIPILTPVVTGVRLTGKLGPQATATDAALTVTRLLREKGVVGQFVEYFGPGLDNLSLADRGPIANMAPEYGATTGFFPIDDATLAYLRETGRSEEHVRFVEHYCKEQGLFRTSETPDPEFSDVVELDLSTIEPCVAGPRKPHEQIAIQNLGSEFDNALTAPADRGGFAVPTGDVDREVTLKDHGQLAHGSVVIASITSCTNTSSPDLMLGAALMARKAVERGLTVPPYVKTSLAPGSRVVTDYLEKSGLLPYLEKLGFNVVAYGCATCIGNSGPLPQPVATAITGENLITSAVVSGNRNFEGRIHPLTKANYLCSPLLVLAYALRGTVRGDITKDPIGADKNGQPVYLKDLWPNPSELKACSAEAADTAFYAKEYGNVAEFNPLWNQIAAGSGAVYGWDTSSTYVQEPPFFIDFEKTPGGLQDISGARTLAVFGDFITTDHISPAATIPADGPAGKYLASHDVGQNEFNSFGSRRGNHEVMLRGTFANIRIRNRLVDREGGWTVHMPSGDEASIYDTAMRYAENNVPLVILAGKMYGAGSSRDWAAKGTQLLGVKAVIAESFERIHRSNLVEMGVLPLEFIESETTNSLRLTGTETFNITDIANNLTPGKLLRVEAKDTDGHVTAFDVKCRIDAPIEVEYYRHGGILQYVLRKVMEL